MTRFGAWKYCLRAITRPRVLRCLSGAGLFFLFACFLESRFRIEETADRATSLFLIVFGGSPNGVIHIIPQCKNLGLVALLLCAMSSFLNERSCFSEIVVARCGSTRSHCLACMICGTIFPFSAAAIRLLAHVLLGCLYGCRLDCPALGKATMATIVAIELVWLLYGAILLYTQRSDRACVTVILACLMSVVAPFANFLFPFAYEDMLRWAAFQQPFATPTHRILLSWGVSSAALIASLMIRCRKGGVQK